MICFAMKDSKRYFHPETIKRIARLDLRARYIVEGLLSGMHRSVFFGQSIEFRQHRDYVPGDDLRHVDWKLWARQDKLSIKQYEEETSLNCHLLVDRSASMDYRSGSFSKYDYAATIACCLAYLIIRQKDNVGCGTFDAILTQQVPCRNAAHQLEAIAQLLDSDPKASKTSLAPVLGDFAGSLHKKGLVIVISDFLDEIPSVLNGLRQLRQRGHDLLLIHLLDPDEVEFPFDGPTHFAGLESDAELKCQPAAFRDAYLDALTEHRHELMQACSSVDADYEFCTTDMAFNTVISSLLNRRSARQRT